MSPKRLLFGFLAGFLAVLAFHQSAIGVLYLSGVLTNAPWSFAPTVPLGIPQVLSAAFFGGLWGILLALIEPRFPRGAAYWMAAFVFGAVAPSLVGWFVVQPLKGLPIGNGFPMKGVAIALFVNGCWGVGAALLFSLLNRSAIGARGRPFSA